VSCVGNRAISRRQAIGRQSSNRQPAFSAWADTFLGSVVKIGSDRDLPKSAPCRQKRIWPCRRDHQKSSRLTKVFQQSILVDTFPQTTAPTAFWAPPKPAERGSSACSRLAQDGKAFTASVDAWHGARSGKTRRCNRFTQAASPFGEIQDRSLSLARVKANVFKQKHRRRLIIFAAGFGAPVFPAQQQPCAPKRLERGEARHVCLRSCTRLPLGRPKCASKRASALGRYRRRWARSAGCGCRLVTLAVFQPAR